MFWWNIVFVKEYIYIWGSAVLIILNIEKENILITCEELLLFYLRVPLRFIALYFISKFANVAIMSLSFLAVLINLLAPELFFLILAHPVYIM